MTETTLCGHWPTMPNGNSAPGWADNHMNSSTNMLELRWWGNNPDDESCWNNCEWMEEGQMNNL
jgi:hypothetical protein